MELVYFLNSSSLGECGKDSGGRELNPGRSVEDLRCISWHCPVEFLSLASGLVWLRTDMRRNLFEDLEAVVAREVVCVEVELHHGNCA